MNDTHSIGAGEAGFIQRIDELVAMIRRIADGNERSDEREVDVTERTAALLLDIRTWLSLRRLHRAAEKARMMEAMKREA